jgi:8-oxo-dGTP pyrophosphatase MutT (NUDIX family)
MYRQGVSVLILNDKQEILLVNLTSFEHYFFAIPGGGIDGEESLEDTVYREVKEELGIDKELLQMVGRAENSSRFNFKTSPRVMHGVEYVGQERHFFLVKFLGQDSDIKLAEDEVRKYVWSNYQDLDKYLLFEGQLEITQQMLKELAPENVA